MKSLQKNANLILLKMAFLLTGIIFCALGVVSYWSFQTSKIETIKEDIYALTNSYNEQLSENNPNFDLLIKEILRRTNIQQVIVVNSRCESLATSFLERNPPCEDTNFQKIEFRIKNEKFFVLFEEPDNFKSVVGDGLITYIFIFLTIYLVSFIFLWIIYRKSFLKQLSNIKNDLNTELPSELNFIGDKLIELKSSIQKHEKQEQYFKIARQVVHDIRTPLAHLKLQLGDNSPEELKRIDEIEFHMMNLLNSSKTKRHPVDLRQLLDEVSKVAKEVYNLKIDSKVSTPQVVETCLHYFDLKNIIINLIRNSREAGAKEALIETNVQDDKLRFVVADNGKGIEDKHKDKIFSGTFTTKKNGNGLGLSNIKNIVNEANGEINLINHERFSCAFEILLPITNIQAVTSIVLIDDDKFIHLDWSQKAKKRMITLLSFKSFTDFMEKSHSIPKTTPIYIDSSLNADKPGEILARDIFNSGFKEIYLATSFGDLDKNDYPWIANIVGKNFPY